MSFGAPPKIRSQATLLNFTVKTKHLTIVPADLRSILEFRTMSSLRKLESARASGARSHGPVTAEGQQRSAQNPMPHAPLTRCPVLDNEESIGLVLRYDTRLHCMYQRPPKSQIGRASCRERV